MTNTSYNNGQPLVSAPSATYQGISHDGVNRFLGIRYASPPVGGRRFRAPELLPDTSSTIQATQFGAHSYQYGLPEILQKGFAVQGEASEDCLFLNVYAPGEQSNNAPVMVWIHGGAFIGGEGAQYDPHNLVQEHGVVVVTINYRLGLFGFVDLRAYGDEFAGSNNLGLQDQISALTWISRNIEAFGGDPDNVTIWGESAGAGSVLALLGAPSAEGLFHKAMAFSGGETLVPSFPQTALLAPHLGLEPDDHMLDPLMTMDASEINRIQIASMYYAGPSIDGVVVTRPACEAIKDGGASHVPIITGSTKDEGTLLAPDWAVNEEVLAGTIFALAGSISRDDGQAYRDYLSSQFGHLSGVDQLSQVWSDLFRSAGLRVAKIASEYGAGGWTYQFEVETEHPLGVTHFSDVPFAFNWVKPGHPKLFAHEPTQANQQLSKQWSSTLVAFARNGTPSGAGLPGWPTYKSPSLESLRLSHSPEIVSRYEGDSLLKLYRVI